MFEKGDKPLICTFVQEDNFSDALKTERSAIEKGTDVLGLQIETLMPSERTEENVRKLIESADGLPVYLTDYVRFDRFEKRSHEEKARELLLYAKCGADLVDLPANFFSNDEYELTQDPSAVKKQKDFVKAVHDVGKKVLFSTHVLQYTPSEEVLRIAFCQQERGADVVKIVTGSGDENELIENLRTTKELSEKLSVPFVFVSCGAYGKTHRMIGPYLGACMWFCAPKYGKYDTPSQPTIEEVRALRKERN